MRGYYFESCFSRNKKIFVNADSKNEAVRAVAKFLYMSVVGVRREFSVERVKMINAEEAYR